MGCGDMRYKLEEILNRIRGGLIVSCQALEGEPLHGSEYMAKMAKAAFQGGAVAIRANSPEDIKAIKREVPLPVIGLYKVKYDDSPVYITPTFKEASLLAEADMIAIDATAQPRPGGEDLKELIRRIHNELHLPILADVSNSEEGIKAASYGADLISTALSGYVNCEVEPESPDFELVRALSQKIEVPILAEGRIHFPHEAAELLNLGAYAIVIGGAITRPQEITKRFVRAIEKDVSQYAVGIDIGGTNTKLGIVNGIGEVIINKSKKTDAKRGGAALLSSLVDWIGELLDEANVPITGIGLGSPGAINSKTGKVVWASENLPGWGGTELAKTLINKYKVPVRVTNDVNAVALGERWRGAAKGHRNVICITLGTGIGAGIICDGKLLEGAIGYAGEIGHICVEMNGRE